MTDEKDINNNRGRRARAPSVQALRIYWSEATLVAGLAVYSVLAVFAYRYAYFEWDLRLARAIQSIGIPGFKALMVFISALGSGWLAVAVVGAGGIGLILFGRRIEGIVCMSGVGIGWWLTRALKIITARPRPDGGLVEVLASTRHESFPSGHVTFFVEYFGFLLFLSIVLMKSGVPRHVAIAVLSLLIVLVGISRVYLGVHWPSDVVGAYLAGGVWLLLMIETYRRWKRRRDRRS